MTGQSLKKLIAMNQQPDKLFREKLEDYHKPAPASAWDKIEEGLSKKNSMASWFRASAAVVLLAAAAFILWPKPNQTHELQPLLAKAPEPEVLKKDEHQESSLMQESAKPATAENVRAIETNQTPQKEVVPTIPVQQEAQTLMSDEIKVASNDANHADNIVQEVIDAVVTSEKTESVDQPVTLVYTAEEVNAKYFKQEAYFQATSDKKKTSTLKRLLNKANDLKNNDPFGELRQKKNEILALNSITGKQRTETK